jgi:hypothetical protein
LTFDADLDGFNGPRAGFSPGETGACGDDCDDRSAQAFPGNTEVCDGVDNDCNGVIDDGAAYAAGQPAVRVSSREYARAGRGGFVATGDMFALTYTGNLEPPPGSSSSGRDVAELEVINPQGKVLYTTKVTDPNSNAFAGSLAWSGQTLATAWSDARQGSYDIFSRTFNATGDMLAPEQRVSSTPSFSLSPNIAWNQTEFLVFWDDRRDEGSVTGDHVEILAQRLHPDGSLFGENVLVVNGPITENPMPAFGAGLIGLTYTNLVAGVSRLGFRVLDQKLQTTAQAMDLGTDVEIPSLHFVAGRFIAFWVINSNNTWGDAVWAAIFDTNGALLVPPTRVTSGARFARSHSELSLLAADLRVLVPRQRLTTTATPSLSPALAAGPQGTIGVLYNDSTEGPREVWFKTLECVTNRP